MLNLKNTLLTLTLVTGTITLAYEEFHPKLIIKNISNATLTLYASDNLITQLKLENSPLLHTVGCYQELRNALPFIAPECIILEPNTVLVSNSVDIWLRNQDTQLLSPKAYSAYCRCDEIRSIFDNITRDVKPIVSQEMKEQAEDLKKDIMICVAPMLMKINPPIPYLAIIKTELVDRT
jgi:hypothetical protein